MGVPVRERTCYGIAPFVQQKAVKLEQLFDTVQGRQKLTGLMQTLFKDGVSMKLIESFFKALGVADVKNSVLQPFLSCDSLARFT